METLIKICNIHNYNVLCVHANKLLIELRHRESSSHMLKQVESSIAEHYSDGMNLELYRTYQERCPEVVD